MKVCPKCGKVAAFNSYFNAYICNYCGWEERRNTMCKFCESEPFKKDYSASSNIHHYFTEDYKLSINLLDKYGSSNAFADMQMNYCPICGKSLQEKKRMFIGIPK